MATLHYHAPTGDDCFHAHWVETHGRPIVQVCTIVFRTEVSFQETLDRLIQRTQDFLAHHLWLPDRCTRRLLVLPSSTDVYTAVYQHATIALLAEPDARRVVLFLNHQNVGGGDFLQFSTYVFGGEQARCNSLLPLPTPWHMLASVARAMYALPSHPPVVGPTVCPTRRTLQTRLYYAAVDLTQFDRSVAARKFQLVQQILQFLFRGYDQLDELSCWLPVAFVKNTHSRTNAIGILPFRAQCGASPMDTQQQILANQHLALFSYTLQGMPCPAQNMVSWAEHVRQRVDVVLSLGQCCTVSTDTTGVHHAVQHAYSGMLYEEKDTWQYPVYVLSSTFDDIAHVTISVNDAWWTEPADLGQWSPLASPFLSPPGVVYDRQYSRRDETTR